MNSLEELVVAAQADFVAAVDAVSARLDSDVLQALNGEVLAGRQAADVAADWLASEGRG